jgi:hypothetical protein
VVEGTHAALPKHGVHLRAGDSGRLPILVRVLDPIHPSDVGHDREELEKLVRQRIAEQIAALRGVAAADVA